MPRPNGLSRYIGLYDPNTPGVFPLDMTFASFVPFNVTDFGAVGDGVTDDTAAIQRAIEAAKISSVLTAGTTPAVVWFGPGTYLVSGNGLRYYPNIVFAGPNVSTGNYGAPALGAALILMSASNAGAFIFNPVVQTTPVGNVVFTGLVLSVFGNANALGCIDLTNCGGCLVRDCGFSGGTNINGACIQWLGGPVPGNAGFGTIERCGFSATAAFGACILMGGSAAGDQPDGVVIAHCYASSGAPFFNFVSNAAGHGPGSLTVFGLRFEGGPTAIATDARGYGAQFFGCRFENTGGNLTLTLTGVAFSGEIQFYGCTFAASGVLTITDNGAVPSAFYGCGQVVGSVGNYLNTLGHGLLQRSIVFAAGTNFTVNLGSGNDHLLPANNTPANVALNASTFPTGQTSLFAVTVRNTTGGAVVWNFNAVYHFAGAFVAPAAGLQRTYWFRYDPATGTAQEISRSPADVTP